MKKRSITFEEKYNDKSIMTDKARNLGCDTKILHELERQFNYAKDTKSKTLFMRADIRFPDGYSSTDNKFFQKFSADYMKCLKRQGLSPQYLAVREQGKEENQHYHMALLLDGKKTKSSYNHIRTAERIWRNKLGIEQGQGLIDDCSKNRNGEPQVNAVMLYPKDDDYEKKLDDCFRRGSYLAKENTKSKTPEGCREMFSSRISKDKNKK